MIPGRQIPPKQAVDRFFHTMDMALSVCKPNEIIGVHCTHGINRTGYLICRYLIQARGWDPSYAVKEFEKARGYKIERPIYTNDLAQTRPLENYVPRQQAPVIPRFSGPPRIPSAPHPMIVPNPLFRRKLDSLKEAPTRQAGFRSVQPPPNGPRPTTRGSTRWGTPFPRFSQDPRGPQDRFWPPMSPAPGIGLRTRPTIDPFPSLRPMRFSCETDRFGPSGPIRSYNNYSFPGPSTMPDPSEPSISNVTLMPPSFMPRPSMR